MDKKLPMNNIMTSLYRNRELIWQLTRREIVGRYRGSLIGVAWSFFHPILMLGIYTFVFSFVFKARWGIGGNESQLAFALILFAGLIVFNLFAECINRAPGLILANANYVKKVVFPLEILPFVAMGTALFHALVSLSILTACLALSLSALPWTFLLLPLIFLPLILATLGFAWFLAALGVFIRDIAQITSVFTTVLMFLSPIFYPISALPEQYRLWLMINPLTFIIEEARKVLILGILPDWSGLSIYCAASILIAWCGFLWFQKLRKGFADVL